MLTAAQARSLLDYEPATGLFRWRSRAGNRPAGTVAGHKVASCDGRIQIRIERRAYQAHRLAWLIMYGEWPPALIDHINGDPTDNRLANLRAADAAQNNHNKRKWGGSSRLKGVTRTADGKWWARIGHQNKQINLGRFDNEDAAHAAYRAKALELFGEFARAA